MFKYRIVGENLFKVYPSFMDQIGVVSELGIDKNVATIYYTVDFNPFLKSNYVTRADIGDIEVC